MFSFLQRFVTKNSQCILWARKYSIYITTDDDFGFLFMKKFIHSSNLSDMYSELPVGVYVQVKYVCKRV
jgi:hypothetical protein